MRILITGGSGFIGRNLVDHLKFKYKILAPSHSELELLDESAVREYFNNNKVDFVIHSAVRPGHRNAKDPTRQLYNNLRMFFNIMRNKSKFDKLIFLSSGAVYDVSKPLVKVNEDYFGTHVPADEHGFSKYIISRHISEIKNAVELRIFGIFGKYEDYAIRFISNAICKTIFDLPITINQDRKMDYLYINDLMPVVEYFINNCSHFRSYNVTPDNSIRISVLAEKVRSVCGKDTPIIIKSEDGIEYSGDNARLRKEIPGLKFTYIDTAIRELYEWYNKNKDLIDKDILLSDK